MNKLCVVSVGCSFNISSMRDLRLENKYSPIISLAVLCTVWKTQEHINATNVVSIYCLFLNYMCFLCLFYQCSVTCGVGVQNRDVYCRLKSTGRVREDLCDAHQRPATARPCQTAECTHYTWVAGEWEEVSTFFLSLPICNTPMNRCSTISLRFLWAEISALPLFLCTIKWTTCRYPCSVSREGLGDNHQSANHIIPQSTDGHHVFCPAEYHCSVSR